MCGNRTKKRHAAAGRVSESGRIYENLDAVAEKWRKKLETHKRWRFCAAILPAYKPICISTQFTAIAVGTVTASRIRRKRRSGIITSAHLPGGMVKLYNIPSVASRGLPPVQTSSSAACAVPECLPCVHQHHANVAEYRHTVESKHRFNSGITRLFQAHTSTFTPITRAISRYFSPVKSRYSA